jgi:hypothetical protein
MNSAAPEHLTLPGPDRFIARSTENLCEAVVVADQPPRKNTTTIALAVFGVSAIIAAMVVLGVCFSGDCGSNDSSKNLPAMTRSPTYPPTVRPTSNPTPPPIDVMAEQVVADFVNNISYSDQEIIVNGTSAESRALTWLIQEDTLFSKTALLTLNSQEKGNEVSRRVRQRYPLATLWFQQVDENGDFVNTWANTSGWLDDESECDWFGIFCDVNINVNQIVFYDYLYGTKFGNNYVGSIPPDIGLLTSLRNFSLQSNNVSGTIPESLGQCSQMYFFSIQNNSISGTIPSSLGRWTDINAFDVSYNEIIGTIPDSLVSWNKIFLFSVGANMLTGSIPSLVAQWSGLQYFGMNLNQFSYTIPHNIGNLTDLILFAATTNRLTGTLPISIGRMTSLQIFAVNDNLLTGTIPSSVGNWSQISDAFFESNNFTGTMPAGICTNIQTTDTLRSDCNVDCSCCTLCL